MATYTPNLNLKKPDYTDLADVADFNANMDIIDGLTQDDIPDGTTNKVFTATEKDKLAGIEPGANKTTIANNLTETIPGKALDATQGKALAEQISTHTESANPHGTTKADVGLGNVDNVKQMPIAGGTFTGAVTAQSNTAYTTRQIRNIVLSTSDPSGGENGDIWIKYI